MPLAKGGKRSPFYSDIHLLLRWGSDARELKAHTSAYREVRGWGSQWTAALNGYELYGRPGLTWTLRTSLGFSMRAMPTGCVFADKGPAAFTTGDDGDALLALLAVSNSSIFSACLELQLAAADAAARSYEVGIVQRTPVPEIVEESRCALAGLGRRAWSLKRTLDTHTEISHAFTLPALLQVPGADIEARVNARSQQVGEIEDELACIQSEIDERCFDLYEIDEADRRAISDGIGVGTSAVAAIEVVDDEDDVGAVEACEEESPLDAAGLAAELVSWAVGVTFGRFDVRLATASCELSSEPEPFDPLPACSPGMLTGADGLPALEAPRAYPASWSNDGILVDDAGHPDDLTTRVRGVFEVVFGVAADAWWQRCGKLLGGDPHRWLSRGFFESHLRGYSQSRRKAPIYWQLSTPTASYSVWLYAHRTSADTMYRVVNDFITPKLRHEESRLTNLRQEAGPSPSASQRKDIESQRDFVEELRSFRVEAARIAPLWRPELDDGILVACAPLWRLVPQHRVWQRETKVCWVNLTKGEFDWAHLAMHLWPERVVHKCAHDRSLAIAHGLEEELWAEDADGKWASRQIDSASVERLVQERSSAAVKAAMADLLAAG